LHSPLRSAFLCLSIPIGTLSYDLVYLPKFSFSANITGLSYFCTDLLKSVGVNVLIWLIACTYCIYEYFDFNFSMTLVFNWCPQVQFFIFSKENYEERFPILYLS
jgi:hypothetical protein